MKNLRIIIIAVLAVLCASCAKQNRERAIAKYVEENAIMTPEEFKEYIPKDLAFFSDEDIENELNRNILRFNDDYDAFNQYVSELRSAIYGVDIRYNWVSDDYSVQLDKCIELSQEIKELETLILCSSGKERKEAKRKLEIAKRSHDFEDALSDENYMRMYGKDNENGINDLRDFATQVYMSHIDYYLQKYH